MRHFNVGPSANKLSAATPPTTHAIPTSPHATVQAAKGAPARSSSSRVFAADSDQFALAEFEPQCSVQHVKDTLMLSCGGLKLKGGSDTFLSDATKLVPGADYVVIGSAGIRLRVAWKGNKVMVPYPFPSHQVIQLMEEVAVRFTRFHTGDTELKMSELRTADGYLINKYDRIMEAVHDGDVLEAVDFDTWLKEQAQLCKEKWLEVHQTDFVDDAVKWAVVGKHAHGKLFVQTGSGKQVDKLELFEIEDLKMFAKEGKQQILHSKGQNDTYTWTSSASFSVNATGQVTAVVLEVKSLSDLRPIVKEMMINIENNNQLVKGDVRVLQLAEEDVADGSNEKPLPPAKKEENPIVQPPFAPPCDQPLATAQAVQRLKVEQVEQVYADQTWARDGAFDNNFYLHFSFTNPSDELVTIAKVKTEYESAPNKWVAANTTAIGSKGGFYDYRWNWDSSNFSVGPHAIEKVAVLCSLTITAPQVDRLRRAHRSLPYPLKIRSTFEDDQGATSYIDVVFHNKPLELPTKESVEKYNSKQYDFWAQLDDADTESRHYVSIARIKEDDDKEYLEIRSSLSSSTYYFYRDDLQRHAFEGVRDGTDTVEITSLKAENKEGSSATAYAMVDRPNRRVYAIKWLLKTNGGYLEDYYKIKPLLYNI